MTNLDCILKSRDYFANKRLFSQGCGFSSSHVWMWELDYKESWVPKNQCFWTVALEKTLESPLDCKEIQPVHPEGYQSWAFIGRTDVETSILWPPDVKSWLIEKELDAGKDWRQDKGMKEDEMFGWHHRLDGHGFGWSPGVGDVWEGLASCGSWGCKELDMTEWLNWPELTLMYRWRNHKKSDITTETLLLNLKKCPIKATPAGRLYKLISMSNKQFSTR